MRLGNSDSSQPRTWSSPREQIRLFSMVCTLCLVMVGIQYAAKPENWHWLLPPEATPTAEAEADYELTPLDLEPAGEDLSWLERLRDEQSQTWAAIDHDKFGVTAEESPLYYQLVGQLKQRPIAPSVGRTDALYVNLLQTPQDYVGEVLTVTGTARRMSRFVVGANEQGIENLYEAWFFTSDSGNNPWRVVVSSLGQGIAELEAGETPIQVTGVFFKRFGYASNNGTHQAPLLLASSIVRPSVVPTSRPIEGSLIPYLTGFVILIGLFVLFVVWQFTRDRSRQKKLNQRIETHQQQLAAVDLSQLEVDTETPVWQSPDQE